MVHDRLEHVMPAAAEVVFDAFHYHLWRHSRDSLVNLQSHTAEAIARQRAGRPQ